MKSFFELVGSGRDLISGLFNIVEIRTIWDFLYEEEYYTITLDKKHKLNFELSEDGEMIIVTNEVVCGRYEVLSRIICDTAQETVDEVYREFGVKIDICNICGRPFVNGYTSLDKKTAVCDKCVKIHMDCTYPKGWRKGENHFFAFDEHGKVVDPGLRRLAQM